MVSTIDLKPMKRIEQELKPTKFIQEITLA